jgi:hypothetical protein
LAFKNKEIKNEKNIFGNPDKAGQQYNKLYKVIANAKEQLGL